MDGGGSLANQGAHLLDLISWFMGDYQSVYGETAIMNHDIETEDIGLAIVNFKSGAKGVIVGTTTFPESVYFSAEVHGTDGGILIDEVEVEMKVKLSSGENDKKSKGQKQGQLRKIITDFSNREGGKELATIRVKFKGKEPPEGLARIKDNLIKFIPT